MKKCMGCGIELQINNSDNIGYVLDLEKDYCLRCFKIKNHNNLLSQEINQKSFTQNIISLCKNIEPKTFYYVLDLFDINNTRIKEIEKLIFKFKVVIIVNKIDLLPKSVKYSKIREYVSGMFSKDGFKNTNIFLLTTKKQNFIDSLFNSCIKEKNDQYFIGVSNVGKSSIINALSQKSNVESKILVSKFFNTTLDFINIKLTDAVSIYDTPGIIKSNFITNFMDKKYWKYSIFDKELKQFSYNLDSEQTIFFAGICWVDFYFDKTNSIHIYTNKEIKLHRTKQINSLNYFEKNFETLEPIIYEKDFLYKKEFIFDKEQEIDLVISGVGWIQMKVNKNTKLVFNSKCNAKDISVYYRKPLI